MGNIDNPMVNGYWKTVPYNTLGLVDIYVTGLLNFDVICDVEVSIAEHIVALHNAWWDKTIWDSYQENIMLSDILAFYSDGTVPLPEGVQPYLTDTDCCGYDHSHETPRQAD